MNAYGLSISSTYQIACDSTGVTAHVQYVLTTKHILGLLT